MRCPQIELGTTKILQDCAVVGHTRQMCWRKGIKHLYSKADAQAPWFSPCTDTWALFPGPLQLVTRLAWIEMSETVIWSKLFLQHSWFHDSVSRFCIAVELTMNSACRSFFLHHLHVCEAVCSSIQPLCCSLELKNKWSNCIFLVPVCLPFFHALPKRPLLQSCHCQMSCSFRLEAQDVTRDPSKERERERDHLVQCFIFYWECQKAERHSKPTAQSVRLHHLFNTDI